MFESTAVGIVVLVIVAVLAAVAGFFVGKSHAGAPTGQFNARDVERLRQEAEHQQLRATQAEAQLEGAREQLAYVKSQLEQTQQTERLRAQASQGERNEVLQALAPVQRNLDMLQHKVQQIEEGRKQEMGALGQQLRGLGEQQLRLDKQTNALSAALSNNKVRGAWGEAQLRNIVESAGLTAHIDFDTQVVVSDANGNQLRPDMVVHLPGGKSIPIDAKAPYADYQRACQIPDSASDAELHQRAQLLQAHAKALREHVRALSDKAYWKAFDEAPDFVIAFIPNEALLQAALETDPTLLDDAFARKVALTSPVTLWAVLKSIAYAWQQQSLTDDAKQLFDVSREIYERFAILGERATALGKQITKTVGAYNQFVGTLETRVLPSARKLQRIDANKVIDQVNYIESEQGDIRDLTAPELSGSEDNVKA